MVSINNLIENFNDKNKEGAGEEDGAEGGDEYGREEEKNIGWIWVSRSGAQRQGQRVWVKGCPRLSSGIGLEMKPWKRWFYVGLDARS